jgi:hypothetical protein
MLLGSKASMISPSMPSPSSPKLTPPAQAHLGRKRSTLLRLALALMVVLLSVISLYSSHNHISHMYVSSGNDTTKKSKHSKKSKKSVPNSKEHTLRSATKSKEVHTSDKDILWEAEKVTNELNHRQHQQQQQQKRDENSERKLKSSSAQVKKIPVITNHEHTGIRVEEKSAHDVKKGTSANVNVVTTTTSPKLNSGIRSQEVNTSGKDVVRQAERMKNVTKKQRDVTSEGNVKASTSAKLKTPSVMRNHEHAGIREEEKSDHHVFKGVKSKENVTAILTPKLRLATLDQEVKRNDKQQAEKKKNQTKQQQQQQQRDENVVATTALSKDTMAFNATMTATNPTRPFKRYDNAVIATKIHGPHQWEILEQSLCLLHHAYNHRVQYNIVVFTAEPIPQENIDNLQKYLGNTTLSVEMDNRGFQEEIAALPSNRYNAFLKMCNVTSPANLTWWSKCKFRLAYNWQAEFRSLHIWHHPALQDYKYMLWMDTDGFSTKPWQKDPVEYFIENDGVIMFDHFPQAKSNMKIQPYVHKGFNHTICALKLNDEGNLVTTLGDEGQCHQRGVPNIHGFFHITNLDFYRSAPVKEGLEKLFGDCFLCREPDDQLAVTVPAAILAPERSWEMRSKGIHLDVFHNGMMDGLDLAKPAGFKKYCKAFEGESVKECCFIGMALTIGFPPFIFFSLTGAEVGKYDLPSADGICPIVAKN